MNRESPSPLPVSNLMVVAGAALSILLAGTEDAWAIAVFLGCAGAALMLVKPALRPGFAPVLLAVLFACLSLGAFLPQSYFPLPAWRALLESLGSVPLAESVNPQPWLGWFWWWLLAGTCLVYIALLTAPLETKALAMVLQAAALFVALYACAAMFSSQTGWRYPFHGGAVFGFLPNRNHTATLLVVGSVLSFGLMQWRLARGDKAAAAFAALCGGASLAALLFYSMSRAGVVFLATGLVVWAVGVARSPLMRKRILAAVVVLTLFSGLLVVLGGSTVRDRLAELWKEAVSVQLEGGGQDVDFRQPVFRDSFRMINDFPIVGAGLGQFSYVFPQYRHDSVRTAKVLHPESDWLMVVAESGLPSALVLAALLVWYAAACWRSRAASGGMLRWTAASAVIAAAFHGLIDVPWHRVSLGWFLLAIAASSVPSSGKALPAPRFFRLFFVIGGLALLAAAGWIGHEKREGRVPAPYAWPGIAERLACVAEEQGYEQAELAAQEAVRQFPLRYESHYWLAAHLRPFEETGPEIDAAVRAGLAVEPVLPKVPAEQAAILQPVNPDAALESWAVAIDRYAAIEARGQKVRMPYAGEYIRRALVAFKGDKERQLRLAQKLSDRPVLLAYWLDHADKEASADFIGMMPDQEDFFEKLPPDLRRRMLSRWISLPDASRAVAFMEAHEASGLGGAYWPVLAQYYAGQNDLPRAVRHVASACGVVLEVPIEAESGLRGEMAAVIAQGNTVAARRMAQDAVTAPKPLADDLAAAMAYFASQGDWESAWKAASRLATEAKIGQ